MSEQRKSAFKNASVFAIGSSIKAVASDPSTRKNLGHGNAVVDRLEKKFSKRKHVCVEAFAEGTEAYLKGVRSMCA